MMKKTLVALAAVAVTGGAFAQSVMTGSVGFKFQSETAANSTLSGWGVADGAITIKSTDDVEGLGKFDSSIGLAADSGNGSNMTAGNLSVSLTMASGVKLTGSSTYGGSYLGSGLAAAGSDYDMNMSGRIFSTRSSNDAISISVPVMDGLKLGYTHQEADAVAGTGSASALNTQTQAHDTVTFNYAAGSLAADVGLRTYNNQISSTTTSASSMSRGSVSYDLGAAKIGFGMTSVNYTYGNTNVQSGLGINIPMGKLSIGGQLATVSTSGNAAAASNYTRSGTMVGGMYSFSKRSYATAQYYSFDAGSTVSNTSGYRMTVYNTF